MLVGIAWVLAMMVVGSAVWLALELRATARLAARLLAEREAAIRKGRLHEAVVASATSGFALLDARGRVVTVNQQALEQLGLHRRDLGDRELWALPAWGADGLGRLLRHGCARALAGQDSSFQVDSPRERGQVELTFRPVLDVGATAAQVLIEIRPIESKPDGSGNDVRVVEALAAMAQLATRIAHDINNPLAGIRTCFQLVRDGIPKSHPHYRFVDAIDREIDRLAAFSRRLHESFDVRIASEPSPTIRAAAVEASLSVRQPVPPVAVDLELGSAATVTAPVPGLALRLMVGNVIQDLVDASDPGGAVQVRGDVTDGAVVLKVSADARTWTGQGSNGLGPAPGLGIAMFRWFAETLGVRVESTSRLDGSPEVRIHLPSSSATARAIR